MSVTEYVVGFLHDDRRVVLIWKNRPEWQAGKLNGVGGHIEKYDNQPHSAMAREFLEETGVPTLPSDWKHFLTLLGTNSHIYVFAMKDIYGLIDNVKTKTDEHVESVQFKNLNVGPFKTVPNLEWIVPMMRQREEYAAPVNVLFKEN